MPNIYWHLVGLLIGLALVLSVMGIVLLGFFLFTY